MVKPVPSARHSETRNYGISSGVACFGLFAIDQQRKRAGFDSGPRVWILRCRRRWRAEFGAHRVNVVIASIERHGPCALHRRDRLDNVEFILRLFTGNSYGAITTRSKCEARSWVIAVGVDSLADGHGPSYSPVGVVPELHQTIVAANDEQGLRLVNR